MKKYSDLVYRDLRRNKTRGIYTILGVMLGIILLTSIFSINSIFKEVKVQDAIKYYGDYEVLISNLSKAEVEKVKANVRVKSYGRLYVEAQGKIRDNNNNIYIEEDEQVRGNDYSIYALDNEALENIFKYRISINKGDYPKKNGEIILEKNTANVLEKSINDKVVFDGKEYSVVGIYEGNLALLNELSGIVSFNENESKPINMLVNIKEDGSIRNKIDNFIENDNFMYVQRGVRLSEEEMLELEKKVIRVNEGLIEAKIEREGILSGEITEEKIGVLLLNSAIILLTIILIYSSINISIKEKIKSYSLLRCLGATEGKIKYILFKESMIIGVLSIIPGIIFGNILTFSILSLIYNKLNIVSIAGNSLSIRQTTIKVIILSFITLFVGGVVPVIRRDKITLIQSLKSSRYRNDIKKKRKNKFVRKIFGYKGELAYKNIRGKGKTFILTVTILSLLIIIFTAFSSYYLGVTKEYKREINSNLNYDVRLNFESEDIDGAEMIQYVKEKADEIKAIVGDKVVERIDISAYGEVKNNSNSGINSKDRFEFIVLNDEGFKQIEKKLNGSVTLEEFKNNGIISINGKEISGFFNIGYKPVYDFSKGEEVNIDVYKDDENKKINLTYQGSIDGLYVQHYKYIENKDKIAFIISMDTFLANKDAFKSNDGRNLRGFDLSFNLNDEEKLMDINSFCTLNKGYLIDYKSNAREYSATLFSLSIIINTILLISLSIATINIINNKIIQLTLREGEIATFISLGMRMKDIKKVIVLEGVIEFLYSSLIGGGISLVILKVIDIMFKFWGEVPMGYFPIHILLIGIVILFLISILSSVISLRGLNKKELSKVMRGEEYL